VSGILGIAVAALSMLSGIPGFIAIFAVPYVTETAVLLKDIA